MGVFGFVDTRYRIKIFLGSFHPGEGKGIYNDVRRKTEEGKGGISPLPLFC